MSKSLLQRNTRFLMTWLPVVLLICSVAFYVMLRMQANHMQYRQLLLKQSNVRNTFVGGAGAIERHIAGEYDIDETGSERFEDLAEPMDTSIYYTGKQQLLPFQMLTSHFVWREKNYRIRTYVSSTEISHLIIKVFLAQAVILLLLLTAIIFLNKKSAGLLWQPFFSSLNKLKDYDIKQNQPIALPAETGTTEFNELNKTAAALISNAKAAYDQQKQFVENASHEMQTPLAIIRSKLELLASQPGLTEKQASLMGDISDASERISQMNRILLLLAKIENNQFPETERIHVPAMVKQLIDTFKNHYNNFPALTINIDENVFITANRSLIEILVSNLIKNSIIHNIEGGKIGISLSQSCIVIENTGAPSGINTAELFERFKKGSHHTKTMGLGLAIVKQICSLYHYPISYQYEKDLHKVAVHFT